MMMIKRSSCVICIMAIIFRRSSSSANIFVVVRSLLVTMLCYASSISRISLEHRTHLNRIKRRKQVICLLSGIVHCSTLTDRFDFIHLNTMLVILHCVVPLTVSMVINVAFHLLSMNLLITIVLVLSLALVHLPLLILPVLRPLVTQISIITVLLSVMEV